VAPRSSTGCFGKGAAATGRANPLPRTAGALALWRGAGAAGARQISALEAKATPSLVGPAAGFVLATGGGFGHVGLVESVASGVLTTIEGNTNDGGSREGVGVFPRTGLNGRQGRLDQQGVPGCRDAEVSSQGPGRGGRVSPPASSPCARPVADGPASADPAAAAPFRSGGHASSRDADLETFPLEEANPRPVGPPFPPFPTLTAALEAIGKERGERGRRPSAFFVRPFLKGFIVYDYPLPDGSASL